MKKSLLLLSLSILMAALFMSCGTTGNVETLFFNADNYVEENYTTLNFDDGIGIISIDGQKFYCSNQSVKLPEGVHTLELAGTSGLSEEKYMEQFGDKDYSKKIEMTFNSNVEYTVKKSVSDEDLATLQMIFRMQEYGNDMTEKLVEIAKNTDYYFIPSPATMNLLPYEKGSEYSYKDHVELPLEKEMEIIDRLPSDGKYELISVVEYVVNTQAKEVATMSADILNNRLKSLAEKTEGNAILPVYLVRTHNPNHKVYSKAVVLKIIK